MYIHGHVHSRAMIGFLNEEAKNGRTARQGAEAQTRKLKTWGFDFVVDSDANANARKAAAKPTKRDAKPANPFDLDMAAHIGFGVADTTLNLIQRGCYAQIEIMQQGVLRHVNANRCGEITDCKEGGKGINPDFFVGRVAIDAKKAQDKKYDKPFCAVKRTFTGFEYGPVLLQSLKGVTHLGFLVRDLSAASANPFEEGCTFINTPMDRNRTLRMIGHLLRNEVTYPDGTKRRPGNLERLEHLGVQAARHVIPLSRPPPERVSSPGVPSERSASGRRARPKTPPCQAWAGSPTSSRPHGGRTPTRTGRRTPHPTSTRAMVRWRPSRASSSGNIGPSQHSSRSTRRTSRPSQASRDGGCCTKPRGRQASTGAQPSAAP